MHENLNKPLQENNGIKSLFKRDRQPGDLVFALAFLFISLFLISQLGSETKWVKGTKLFAQPAFWPAVSLALMTLFAILHVAGSFLSSKKQGRREELLLWFRSIEYAIWFMVYVWIVPLIGYLPGTLIFVICLVIRTGYRNKKILFYAGLVSIAIVIIFKGFLSVKIPGGQIYEMLPDAIRNFMLLYL